MEQLINEHELFFASLNPKEQSLYLNDVSKIFVSVENQLNELKLKYIGYASLDLVQEEQINDYLHRKKIIDKFLPLMIAYDMYLNNKFE